MKYSEKIEKLKTDKKLPDFWKKFHDCVPLWVKFLVYNVAFRVSRRKNSEIFPFRTFVSYVVDEISIEVPLFQETFRALKNGSFGGKDVIIYLIGISTFLHMIQMIVPAITIPKLINSSWFVK